MPIRFISREIREKVKLLRDEGVSCIKIGQTLGISEASVRRLLITIEPKVRKVIKTGDGRKSNRQNVFNDDYFELIDSDEKAYWLGFFFADGCVTKDKDCESYRCVLSIDSEDIDHIRLFLEAINFDFAKGKIMDKKRKNFETSMTTAQLLSKKMFNDLCNKGCVPRKSNILDPPLIGKEFFRSFIRGFYDGDGGCTFDLTEKTFNGVIGFTSTKSVLTFIRQEIEESTGIPGNLAAAKGTEFTWRLVYGGNRQVFRIFNWLYEDTNAISLNRKIEKARDIMRILILRGETSFKQAESASKIKNPEVLEIFNKFLGEDEVEELRSKSFSGKYSAKAFYDFITPMISNKKLYLN